MKSKSYLSLFLMFFFSVINAQSNYKPGYILKLNGDSVAGSIEYTSNEMLVKLCKFKYTNDSVVEYSPADLVGFRFIDGKYFVSKSVNNQPVFLEFLVKGKLNLYVKQLKTDPVFYIEKDSLPLTEISYMEGTKMVNDKRVYYQTNRHLGILAYYTQDAPQLDVELRKINKPQYDNLISFARDYHNSVCDNESCIVYQKKVKHLSVSLEPIISVNKFLAYEKIKAGYGINVYFSSPVFSENTFFYTGFHTCTVTDSTTNLRFTEIPVQIEYLFGARNFQPKIGLGINLISVKNIDYMVHTFNFNTGFNYKLNKMLSFTFKLNAEFVPASFSLLDKENPINVFALNAMLGLRIRLF